MVTTTIDSILSDFNVKINKLKAISSAKQDEMILHMEKSAAALTAANAAKAESERAESIASRIEALIG